MGLSFVRGTAPEFFGASEAALLSALRDSKHSTCIQAANIAGRERRKDAVPALIELLYRSGKTCAPIRIAAARTLGNIGDLRALHHLGEAHYREPLSDGEEVRAVIQEALWQIFQAPGAPSYAARLQAIVSYRIANFMSSAGIYIDKNIQTRESSPFTMECGRRFFMPFALESFWFEGQVGSIRIYEGKEGLPGHSYANGWLYTETLDEIHERGKWPDRALGEIHFEFGGIAAAPCIFVGPEPNWPRPSIVRRSVIDGAHCVRFEENS